MQDSSGLVAFPPFTFFGACLTSSFILSGPSLRHFTSSFIPVTVVQTLYVLCPSFSDLSLLHNDCTILWLYATHRGRYFLSTQFFHLFLVHLLCISTIRNPLVLWIPGTIHVTFRFFAFFVQPVFLGLLVHCSELSLTSFAYQVKLALFFLLSSIFFWIHCSSVIHFCFAFLSTTGIVFSAAVVVLSFIIFHYSSRSSTSATACSQLFTSTVYFILIYSVWVAGLASQCASSFFNFRSFR